MKVLQGLSAGRIQFDILAKPKMTLDQHLNNSQHINKIKNGKYDIVMLQEQSQTPAYRSNQFYAASRKLDKIIKASGAKTAFYITWGRRGNSYESMQKSTTAAYEKMIKELGAISVQVGAVWAEIKKKDAKLWYKLYTNDNSHPSRIGAFTNALVFISVLLNEKPENIKYDLQKLKQHKTEFVTEKIAKIIISCASNALQINK